MTNCGDYYVTSVWSIHSIHVQLLKAGISSVNDAAVINRSWYLAWIPFNLRNFHLQLDWHLCYSSSTGPVVMQPSVSLATLTPVSHSPTLTCKNGKPGLHEQCCGFQSQNPTNNPYIPNIDLVGHTRTCLCTNMDASFVFLPISDCCCKCVFLCNVVCCFSQWTIALANGAVSGSSIDFKVLVYDGFFDGYSISVQLRNHQWKATFQQMKVCGTTDGVTCTTALTSLFTPNRQWIVDSTSASCPLCETYRSVQLVYTRAQMIATPKLRFVVSGLDAETTIEPYHGLPAFSPFASGCSSDSSCGVLQLADDPLLASNLPWDSFISIPFKADFNAVIQSRFAAGSTADTWTVEVKRAYNRDARLRRLQFTSGEDFYNATSLLPSASAPHSSDGGVNEVSMSLYRRPSSGTAASTVLLSFELNDPAASVLSVMYAPPQFDNGPVSTTRIVTLNHQRVGSTSSYYVDSLRAVGSSQTEWSSLSFGRSCVQVTVRDDSSSGGTKIHRLCLSLLRNSDNALAAMLPSLGVLSPAWSVNQNTYTLLVHQSDPTVPLRVMFSLRDAYANATARLLPLATGASFVASLSRDVEVIPRRTCAFDLLVQVDVPYNRSSLQLTVMADDGSTRIVTITVTKDAIRLLQLSATMGQLEPAFAPQTLSFRLSLPNSLDSADLHLVHADPTATIVWRFQAARSRVGSQVILPTRSNVGEMTSFVSQTVELRNLPIGPACVTVTITSPNDASTNTYFVLLYRAVDPAIQLQGFMPVAAPAAPGLPNSGNRRLMETVNQSTLGVLTPSYNFLRKDYEYTVPVGASVASFRFAASTTTRVVALWQTNPPVGSFPQVVFPRTLSAEQGGGQEIRIRGITERPGKLQIQMKNGSVVLQELNINVTQALSPNAYLGALWVGAGRLTPLFAVDMYSYVWRVSLPPCSNPLEVVPLMFSARVQDRAANLTGWVSEPSSGVSHAVSWIGPVNMAETQLGAVTKELSCIANVSAPTVPDVLLTMTTTAGNGASLLYTVRLVRQLIVLPTPEQLSYAELLQLTLALQMNLAGLDVESIRQQLAGDLSRALNQPLLTFRVSPDFRAGSVMVDVMIVAVPGASLKPWGIWQQLKGQMENFEGSPLAAGNITKLIDPSRIPVPLMGCEDAQGRFKPADKCAPLLNPPVAESGRSSGHLPDYLIGVIVLVVMTVVIGSAGAVWWILRERRNSAKSVVQAHPISKDVPELEVAHEKTGHTNEQTVAHTLATDDSTPTTVIFYPEEKEESTPITITDEAAAARAESSGSGTIPTIATFSQPASLSIDQVESEADASGETPTSPAIAVSPPRVLVRRGMPMPSHTLTLMLLFSFVCLLGISVYPTAVCGDYLEARLSNSFSGLIMLVTDRADAATVLHDKLVELTEQQDDSGNFIYPKVYLHAPLSIPKATTGQVFTCSSLSYSYINGVATKNAPCPVLAAASNQRFFAMQRSPTGLYVICMTYSKQATASSPRVNHNDDTQQPYLGTGLVGDACTAAKGAPTPADLKVLVENYYDDEEWYDAPFQASTQYKLKVVNPINEVVSSLLTYADVKNELDRYLRDPGQDTGINTHTRTHPHTYSAGAHKCRPLMNESNCRCSILIAWHVCAIF